ncbi:hypothetical protein SO802_032262 [Lithocarpus litseifolius]|uniref:Uncharacterized protein n=1 Tax=Lithocarpus litseifolius TaxID=425828 RepID=A0AAW2BPQ2_9ROSI
MQKEWWKFGGWRVERIIEEFVGKIGDELSNTSSSGSRLWATRSRTDPNPAPAPNLDPDSDPGPAPNSSPAFHRLAAPTTAVLVPRRDRHADRLLSREIVLAPAREYEGDPLAGHGGFGHPSLLRRFSSQARCAVPSQDGEAKETIPHEAAESSVFP